MTLVRNSGLHHYIVKFHGSKTQYIQRTVTGRTGGGRREIQLYCLYQAAQPPKQCHVSNSGTYSILPWRKWFVQISYECAWLINVQFTIVYIVHFATAILHPCIVCCWYWPWSTLHHEPATSKYLNSTGVIPSLTMLCASCSWHWPWGVTLTYFATWRCLCKIKNWAIRLAQR